MIIAEFQIGADTVVVLDYRASPQEPVVLRLRPVNGQTSWVQLAPSFDEFARILELDRIE